jgi:hypothetical protein
MSSIRLRCHRTNHEKANGFVADVEQLEDDVGPLLLPSGGSKCDLDAAILRAALRSIIRHNRLCITEG